jgi:hypothetical protein
MSADTLTALVRLLVSGTYTKDLDLADPKDTLNKTIEQAFTTGTGAEQANIMFHDIRSLGDGATEDLDLFGGLTNAFGVTLNFAKLKAMVIKNLSTTQTLSIGGAAATQLSNWVANVSDIVVLPPESFLCLCNPAGYAVTSILDLLKIANSAGAAGSYEIILIGNA